MKLGARVVKTGLAITIALYAATLLGVQAPVFAGVSAIFAIQPSIYRSYITMLDQVRANIIGAIVAILIVLSFGNEPILIGIGAIIVIVLAIQFKMEANISVALVTLVAIMESTSQDFLGFALLRFTSILVGIFSAFLVNLLFLPPKYEYKLFKSLHLFTTDIIKWLRLSISGAVDYASLHTQVKQFRKPYTKLNETYVLYKEERDYFNKAQMEKTRKLVLFKNLLLTSSTAYYLLQKFHKLENEFLHMPEDIQQLVKRDLEVLVNYHEELLMKTLKKVEPDNESITIKELPVIREKLIQTYARIPLECTCEEERKCWIHVLPIVSTMMEYEDQLQHLDQLIQSYHTYHQKDSEINASETIHDAE